VTRRRMIYFFLRNHQESVPIAIGGAGADVQWQRRLVHRISLTMIAERQEWEVERHFDRHFDTGKQSLHIFKVS
jgi:hypothetical protein